MPKSICPLKSIKYLFILITDPVRPLTSKRDVQWTSSGRTKWHTTRPSKLDWNRRPFQTFKGRHAWYLDVLCAPTRHPLDVYWTPTRCHIWLLWCLDVLLDLHQTSYLMNIVKYPISSFSNLWLELWKYWCVELRT